MARGGLRVLCLEKNHFIGGMASTTELARGYRFELAGSIQFPVPNEIFDDLGFGACPIYEPEVQSASVGAAGEPPLLLYSDTDRLLEHLGERVGLDAVLGMAEIAAWAEAPARAIGRFDVRTPPNTLDQMFACATDEKEREAIRIAMFGSVMDVVDRYLPDPVEHAQIRSMLSFLAVNSTFRGPYSPGSALCLAFALASPGTATMSKVRGGIGTMADHLWVLFEHHGGELRRHVKVAGIAVSDGARQRGGPGRRGGGDGPDGRLQPRPDGHLHPAARPRPAARVLRPAHRRHRPPGRLLPGPLRARRAARVHRSLRRAQPGRAPPQRDVLRDRRAAAAATSRDAAVASSPPRRPSTSRSPPSATPAWPLRASTSPAASPSTCRSRRSRADQARLRDEMAGRIVAKHHRRRRRTSRT